MTDTAYLDKVDEHLDRLTDEEFDALLKECGIEDCPKMPPIVNFYGGPGSGKSSMMFSAAGDLKWLGVNAEIAPEFAKQLCWEERIVAARDQHYILGKQYHTFFRLMGIDGPSVIITDGPLLHGFLYREEDAAIAPAFDAYALALHRSFVNINYFLERKKPYEHKGRYQSEEDARKKDVEIRKMLDVNDIQYKVIPGVKESVDIVVQDVLQYLNS